VRITRKPSCLISCSHTVPAGGRGALVGRHGAMKPSGRVRGRNGGMALEFRGGTGLGKGSAYSFLDGCHGSKALLYAAWQCP
jgi:hypothetical protein